MVLVCIGTVFFMLYMYTIWAKEKYEKISAASSLLTMLIAALAAVVAYNQLGESKLVSAKAIYKDYISLAFQNPTFSAASYPVESPRFRSFELDADEYE